MTFLVNASPIVDEDGNRKGILASFDDITTLEEKQDTNGRDAR